MLIDLASAGLDTEHLSVTSHQNCWINFIWIYEMIQYHQIPSYQYLTGALNFINLGEGRQLHVEIGISVKLTVIINKIVPVQEWQFGQYGKD